ncbi:hypothetical protein WAF17_12580 [Bernardetia sp. ABR2-2B]|uniref:hypothetical protein n=1 Tax=Bernardetia sp. ABR2-2B TaxID=3127472 RepID=UPI0030D1AD1A
MKSYYSVVFIFFFEGSLAFWSMFFGLGKYAPKDILLFLEHIKKMKINDTWM